MTASEPLQPFAFTVCAVHSASPATGGAFAALVSDEAVPPNLICSCGEEEVHNMMRPGKTTVGILLLCVHFAVYAEETELSPLVQRFVSFDAPVIAFVGATVIDGTGAPARHDQVVLIRDGEVAATGSSAAVQIPEAAQVLEASGKTIIPGLVMLHEHMFYPAGALPTWV